MEKLLGRGHRAQSFTPIDLTELVEIRARQRTFEGAYARTALGNLGYSLTVLKLFDRRFYRSMTLYTFYYLNLYHTNVFLQSAYHTPSSLAFSSLSPSSAPDIVNTTSLIHTGKKIHERLRRKVRRESEYLVDPS